MRYHYIELLKNIQKQPIISPNDSDFKQLCPHLTEHQIEELRSKEWVCFACPPSYIHFSFTILEFDKKRNQLRYLFVQRRPQSYADGVLKGESDHSYAFMEEASNYATRHWGNELILDNWVSVIKFVIDDPRDKKIGLFGRTPKMSFYVGLNENLNKLNDHSKPLSDLYEKSIIEMTTDVFLAAHLVGGRGSHIASHCGCCGASKSSLQEDKIFDDTPCTSHTPLPKKITDYMEQQGHQFRIAPQIARDLEQKKFRINKLSSKKATELELLALPDKYLCALNATMMTDPVYLSEDATKTRFERDAIILWLRDHGKKHPVTKVWSEPKKIISDTELKKEIEEFVESLEPDVFDKSVFSM
jgi:hypothetical protein